MNEETEDEMDEENEEDGETKEDDYEEPMSLLLILEEAKRSTSEMHHFVAHDVDQRWLRNVEDHAYKIFSQMRNIVESTGRVKNTMTRTRRRLMKILDRYQNQFE